MVTHAQFWDKAAAKYIARPIKDMEAYRTTMARTQTYLSPGNTVLEVGCGSGATALLLAGHVAHITGSDISGNMVASAKASAGTQNVGNADFRQAEIADHVAGGETYDAVLAFNFLHLLEDVPGAVGQIHRLVKPGGMFISKTGCLGRNNLLFKSLIGIMQFFRRAPFVNFLDTEDVDDIIRDQRFEIVETGNYPASPPAHFVVARRLPQPAI